MTVLGEIIPMALVVGGIAFFVILIIKKRGGFGGGFSFKEVPFSDATHKPMKVNIKSNGEKVKGSLHFGYNTIQNVTRFVEFKGQMPKLSYDASQNVYLDEGEKVQHDLTCFEVANGILSKVLGIGRQYYLFDRTKIKVKYDGSNHRWFLPTGITWYSYGDIWIADDTAKEFVRNLAMGFMDESVQTHLMNNPDRVVALDIEHAKHVSIIKETAAAEMNKYREPVRASESEVSK